jgi:rhodanese-related sulfurtransferase
MADPTNHEATRAARTITADKVRLMIDHHTPFTLIDVMAPAQFAESHLPGAINIPLDDRFETAALAAVPMKDRKTVVYCADRSCDAAFRAVQRLAAVGFLKIRILEDGKRGWHGGDGRPVSLPDIALD